jgi:hypothetical protein
MFEKIITWGNCLEQLKNLTTIDFLQFSFFAILRVISFFCKGFVIQSCVIFVSNTGIQITFSLILNTVPWLKYVVTNKNWNVWNTICILHCQVWKISFDQEKRFDITSAGRLFFLLENVPYLVKG